MLIAHVGSGTYEPLQVGALTLVAAAYALRARSLAWSGSPLPAWRLISFAAGLALIGAALIAPVSHIGEELVLAHMAQHLLMGDIGALLLALGLTGPVLQPLLAIRRLSWLRRLTHPVVALGLWVVNLFFWHIPALYQEATFGAEYVHLLMHASFVLAGLAMWMSLLGTLGRPEWFGAGAQLGFVAAVRLSGAVLGNVLMFSGSVFYPDFAAGQAYWGIDPLADQGAAGVLMMIEGSLLTLGTFAWLFLRSAEQGSERQRLLDLAGKNGYELTERRAARAVAAGHGDLLERRIREAALSGSSSAAPRMPRPRQGALGSQAPE